MRTLSSINNISYVNTLVKYLKNPSLFFHEKNFKNPDKENGYIFQVSSVKSTAQTWRAIDGPRFIDIFFNI
jgi:hypothetical protein